jgi:hypothetical protein
MLGIATGQIMIAKFKILLLMVGQHEQTNGKIVDSKLKKAKGARISCKGTYINI